MKPTVQSVKAKSVSQVSYPEWPEKSCFVDIAFHLCFGICHRKSLKRMRKDLKLNGTCQVLAYADNVNIVGKNIRTIQKNADLLDTSNEASLELRTKFLLV
jgi:hypothetical protein